MSRARLSMLVAFASVCVTLAALVLLAPVVARSSAPANTAVHAADAPTPQIWLPAVLNAFQTGGLGPNDPKDWTVASRWPNGPAQKAIPVGERTYFASGAQVEVLNTSNTTVTVDATIALTAAVKDMVFQSPYLLLANNDAGIVMLDTQASVTPTIAGARAQSTKAVKVEVKDQRAYVLFERTGLKVYDISNTANISETGSLFLSGTFTSIARKDTALYIGTGEGALYVVDVSNDQAPKQTTLSNIGGSGAITDLFALNDRLYVVQGSQLAIFGIGTILSPQRRGSYIAPDNRILRGVAVDAVNGRAYVVQEVSPSGFRTIDVTNVDTLSEVGSFVPSAGPAIRAVYDAGRLHLVSRSRYQIVDPATPQDQPSSRGRDAFGVVYDVEVAGSNVYVAGDSGGVAVLNVANPETPQLVARWTPVGWARGLYVTGVTLYSVQVVDGDGLRLVAASLVTPTRPITTGISDKVSLPVGELDRQFEVAVANGYAYVAGAGAGLLTFDVRNATPVLVNQDTNVSARSIDVNNGYLYVGAIVNGATILRSYYLISPGRPERPAKATDQNFSFNGDPGEMLVEEGSLYANIAGAIDIFGIFQPWQPSKSGAAGTPAPGGTHYGITRIRKYVYVTDPMNAVVHVYDAGQTFLPRLYADLTFTGEPGALNDNEQQLFVSDQNAGLVILE